jgi:homoserine O-acetyltransferase
MAFVVWQPSAATQSCQIASDADPFITENGQQLADAQLVYETWGRLNGARDNAMLIFHALTGDAHAASHPELPNDRLGWWEPLLGPGRPLDTERYFVICANTLGSCYGSTGPRSLAPDGARWNLRFPALTVRDLVRAQLRLLERLGIGRLRCVLGGSLGGMETLELITLAPTLTERAVAVAASGRMHSQGIAFNEIQRRAIMLDPAWRGGDYTESAPVDGVALARMLGMVTFQSDESMTLRFGRNDTARYTPAQVFQGCYDIEGYLHYQGEKLARRFDANSYLYLTRAMDSHDLGRGRGGLQSAGHLVHADTLLIGVRSDILFPADHVQATAEALRAVGAPTRYWEINSPHGHDAFLKEFERLEAVLRAGVGGGARATPAGREWSAAAG